MCKFRFTIQVRSQALDAIAHEFTLLARFLRGVPDPPNPQQPLRFTPTGEQDMFIVYDVAIPPLQDVPEAADVSHGEIRFQSDPAQEAVSVSKGAAVHSGVKLLKNVPVIASFGWMDDDGNFSANPTTLPEFTPTDTVAPPDPVEGFGFTATGESET